MLSKKVVSMSTHALLVHMRIEKPYNEFVFFNPD